MHGQCWLTNRNSWKIKHADFFPINDNFEAIFDFCWQLKYHDLCISMDTLSERYCLVVFCSNINNWLIFAFFIFYVSFVSKSNLMLYLYSWYCKSFHHFIACRVLCYGWRHDIKIDYRSLYWMHVLVFQFLQSHCYIITVSRVALLWGYLIKAGIWDILFRHINIKMHLHLVVVFVYV